MFFASGSAERFATLSLALIVNQFLILRMLLESVCRCLSIALLIVSSSAILQSWLTGSNDWIFMYRYGFYLLSSVMSWVSLRMDSRMYWLGMCTVIALATAICLQIFEAYIGYRCRSDSRLDYIYGIACDTVTVLPPLMIPDESIVFLASIGTLIVMWKVHMTPTIPTPLFPNARQHLLSYASDQFISADEGSPRMVLIPSCPLCIHILS